MSEQGRLPQAGAELHFGARAVAWRMFRDDSDAARKRVYNLCQIYKHRKDGPGLKKLGATIVLSETVFQEWLRRGGTL